MSACVRVMAMSEPDADRPVSLEIPKSSTLTACSPSDRTTQKRFAGFRSRWTIPIAWASAIASQACSTNSTACSTGNAPRSLSHAERSRPSRYSMTMYG